MCDKSSYREQGYKPRKSDELWGNNLPTPAKVLYDEAEKRKKKNIEDRIQ